MEDSDWPTLETFSKLAPQANQPSAERRRFPRRDINDQAVQVAREGANFQVVDISIEGVAIRLSDPGDLLLFPVGTVVSGSLNLSGKHFTFNATVRHQRVGIVGCQFEEASSELKDVLAKLLDPASLGKWLKSCAPTEGAKLAYLGPSHTSVMIWQLDSGEVDKIVIYILGFFAAWSRDQGLSTGTVQVKRQSDHRPIEPLEWNVLGQDPKVVRDKISMARILIENSELPKQIVQQCSQILITSSF